MKIHSFYLLFLLFILDGCCIDSPEKKEQFLTDGALKCWQQCYMQREDLSKIDTNRMVIFFSDHTYEYYEKCVDGFYHPLDFCRDKRDEGLTFICSAGRLTDYGDWQLHGENGLKLEDRKYTIISCTSDSLKILEKDGLIRTYRAFKHYDFIHSY